MGCNCFGGCKGLTSIELPEVTNLGSSCFYKCTGLTDIIFGGPQKQIVDTSGFNSSSLSDIAISALNLIIYVNDPGNPPTLTGIPWGATYATIIYEQA